MMDTKSFYSILHFKTSPLLFLINGLHSLIAQLWLVLHYCCSLKSQTLSISHINYTFSGINFKAIKRSHGLFLLCQKSNGLTQGTASCLGFICSWKLWNSGNSVMFTCVTVHIWALIITKTTLNYHWKMSITITSENHRYIHFSQCFCELVSLLSFWVLVAYVLI